MKIDEAILSVLAERNGGLRTEQIADIINRRKLHVRETKKNEGKRDIILAALEKNPNLDTGELIKCFQTGFSTFKERLLKKLLWGSIFTFAGLLGLAMLLIAAIVGGEANKDVYVPVILFAAPALAVGISFLLNYFIGKNMLAKEIEAEKKQRPKE